jgi:2-polyprenyl-6-methoxyphenol hydroxylase-like FAD-dependent oxidoreductase
MEQTGCVVVGGGPGGMMLAYLLARHGIEVTLLEAHRDFDRDFRGDSLHPYTLELLGGLGLVDELLQLDHFPARRFRMHTPAGTIVTSDYGRLDSKYPFVALMPQARFLDFLVERASALPTFRLITGARVRELITDSAAVVRGVRWSGTGVADDGEQCLGAPLIIAADGRNSKLRRLSGLPETKLGVGSDLLWFRLPRRAEDPPEADVDLYFGRRNYVGLLGGDHDWQIGYTLPKGGYAAAREAGVEPIRAFLRDHVGWLDDRIEQLTDFSQTTLLSVEISRLDRWHRPGLLFIGDAAHVISPVGGNGILMAIQDAVTASNLLRAPLLAGEDPVPSSVLAQIQAERMPAIREVQAQQADLETRAKQARERGRPLVPGRLLKIITALPGARARSARSNAYGPYPPRLVLP